ncbi:ATP-dependent helicase [Yokenella regensburgei ATCC 49455]|uniref:DEAD-box ATP-dependent RNA helicase CshA n=2 Tax=Enterobacterales TaxID=91347 RepID=A0AB38G290_9ENTR|nr:ATP-dependent helicase [Yokenella regensburgei ATCC 49455]SQA65309.1 DEAD-box ATP-dependent RNA helicase CshA [Yokenella regensburgei]SQA95760.1 DEAD-box ATP-dependent RNA helicase CshA [Yokenella regensburgei]SUQ03885.1 DEAD-box ATP-dependent RNA helicase CshA [Yokenella regensburgei]
MMMDAYCLLEPRIQKWIYQQGWKDLRALQKKAIPPILAGDRDVLISAATAAGKTEAFFLPACSAIADIKGSFGILYISPLKALINDQYRRLESLGDALEMQVTPWHGDVAQSQKLKAKKKPAGILLITPESLEAMILRNAGWVKQAFSQLTYIAIDEFHAFIGSERGMQLLSLLNRVDHLLGRNNNPVPRIALSATLGELKQVPLSLRANQRLPCVIVTDSETHATLKVQVKGYLEPLTDSSQQVSLSAETQICHDIFRLCRGDSHLVFANSRKRTESIAATLSDLSEINIVPNEFFPHHGSLSRDLREMLELRLQKGQFPTTAICTMTLELGIDIGKVSSVVQVTAPHSVASLRQRMGRSGRRGSPSVLRMLIAEHELTPTSEIIDQLRLQLVQSLAMIRLLIGSKWFEPADTRQMHYSTLFHQILSIVAQWGGVRAEQLWGLLCQQGPFQKVSIDDFKTLLKHMGEHQFLTQLSSGEMTLGVEGERLVNQYTFYTVFSVPEEFRIVTGSKTLGAIPVDSPLIPDQNIIFGGRRWKVIDIDNDKKVIYVEETKGGQPPLFGGQGMSIHDVVRQEMLAIYRDGDYRITVGARKADFADTTARNLFEEGVYYFRNNNLASECFIQQGQNVSIFSWMGDQTVNALSALLVQCGFKASSYAGVIVVDKCTVREVKDALAKVLLQGLPSEPELAAGIIEKCLEKYDEYLPEALLSQEYGLRAFNMEQVKLWLQEHL